MQPLELEFTVACDPARAFSLWAEETTRWWPHGHSVRRDRNRRGWAGVTEHYRRAAE
jgi:hypothetical protein